MCGIAGFTCSNSPYSKHRLENIARRMGDVMHHRGPDAGDIWIDGNSGIVLAHRRLSIIDLSSAGSQPMVSACSRFVIVYNGEIYNTSELRTELEHKGRIFRGHSDTEVVLEACAVWGVEKAATRLNGMFAFALWDCKERRLALVRDRLGIKPLYWAQLSGMLVFGSELKALRTHPAWDVSINRNAVAAYLRRNYIPAPHTIYKGVYKLQPGHILTFDKERGGEVCATPYWSLDRAVEQGQADRQSGHLEDDVGELETILSDAVRRRMVSDVPLGALLSGGIDSSIIIALMQKQSPRPINTFSIGFEENQYDEAPYAAAVAKHLGTDHTELYVTSKEAHDVIPALPDIYDEPFSDSSQIPTYLVSALARQHVTVALSGDGGDELFGGYGYYLQARKYADLISPLPKILRHGMAHLLKAFSPPAWDRLSKAMPRQIRFDRAGEKMHKLALVLTESEQEYHLRKTSHWQRPESLISGACEPISLIRDPDVTGLVPDLTERMQYVDTLSYLPDDILTKVDRASMAVSLEVRVPLLDHRVVEFVWRLPRRSKIRNGKGKWLLRQLLYRYVPRSMIDRPKKGFSIPIDAWLRGPLNSWAEDLLAPDTISKFGLLDPTPVREVWREHISGGQDRGSQLWNVLMLQAWCERHL